MKSKNTPIPVLDLSPVCLGTDEADFLETLLWLSEPDGTGDPSPIEGKSIFDFVPEFVGLLRRFLEAFREHCEKDHALTVALDNCEGPFGGNVFLSLSGAGAGFFDESRTDGEALQKALEEFAGPRRFEELSSCLLPDDGGKVDLAYLPQFVAKEREKLFRLPLTAEEIREPNQPTNQPTKTHETR